VSRIAALIVGRDTPLKDALLAMDAAGEGFLVVQSPDGVVIGIVADGDVRRALIGNIALDCAVSAVMNREFKFWTSSGGYDEAIKYLKGLKVRQLPILNDRRELVDVLFSDHLELPRRDNPVVIMAGGLGTRLRPYTETVPKPMLRVGDRPFLQAILENLAEQGFHRFYFCVNYLADQIIDYFGDGKNWDVDIQYVQEKKRMGTAGALSLIENPGHLPLLVMNGDLITKVDFGALIDHHVSLGKKATMAVRNSEFQIPFGVVEVDDHAVLSIVEKPTKSFLVNAGIYLIEPACLSLIPLGQFYDMPTLLDDLLGQGDQVGYFPLYESWMDIGRIEDYLLALKSHDQSN
jgi:dTDP-glucose pyrophosphorylase